MCSYKGEKSIQPLMEAPTSNAYAFLLGIGGTYLPDKYVPYEFA